MTSCHTHWTDEDLDAIHQAIVQPDAPPTFDGLVALGLRRGWGCVTRGDRWWARLDGLEFVRDDQGWRVCLDACWFYIETMMQVSEFVLGFKAKHKPVCYVISERQRG